MDIESLRYQEAVRAWYRNSLIKELVIIFLSVFGLSVLCFFLGSAIDSFVISIIGVGCFLFFIAIMCSIVSINVSIDALENEIALNGIKPNLMVVASAQMTAFYLAMSCLMLLYVLPVLAKV